MEENNIYTIRDPLFNEERMYIKLEEFAKKEGLDNTLKALEFSREKHKNQRRQPRCNQGAVIMYINHPLTIALHAHALGIRDDSVLAALVLHDVLEDTDATVDELPVSQETKELVSLVTFEMIEGKTKQESKDIYYKKIMGNRKAALIKILDRCNNVSNMAGVFDRKRLRRYLKETDESIIPLMNSLKNDEEYSDIVFVLKYHIYSVVETIKSLLNEEEGC